MCDINEIDRNISPEDVEKNMDENTNTIISVNYAGINSDINSLRKFYKRPIIEDCAWSCYTKDAGLRGDIAVGHSKQLKLFLVEMGVSSQQILKKFIKN